MDGYLLVLSILCLIFLASAKILFLVISNKVPDNISVQLTYMFNYFD